MTKKWRMVTITLLLMLPFVLQSGVEKALSSRSPQEPKQEEQAVSVEVVVPNSVDVNELLGSIRDERLRNSDPERVVQAINQLGESKAVEAIDDLIQLLTFKRITKVEITQIESHFEDPYPAKLALFQIGKPSLPALLKVIESHESESIASKNAVETVRFIFREEPSKGVDYLREASSKASSSDAARRLSEAADSIQGTMR